MENPAKCSNIIVLDFSRLCSCHSCAYILGLKSVSQFYNMSIIVYIFSKKIEIPSYKNICCLPFSFTETKVGMCVKKCWQAISKFSPRVVHNCVQMSLNVNNEMTALKLMYIIIILDDDDSNNDSNNDNYIKSDHYVQQSLDRVPGGFPTRHVSISQYLSHSIL